MMVVTTVSMILLGGLFDWVFGSVYWVGFFGSSPNKTQNMGVLEKFSQFQRWSPNVANFAICILKFPSFNNFTLYDILMSHLVPEFVTSSV